MSHPNTDRDERVRQLISELSNVEFEARGLARSRYHDRLFAANKPRPTNEQFDEGWSAAKNFYTTAMRDLCVTKVREIHEERLRELRALTEQGEVEQEDADYERAVLFVLSNVITALQSLTLGVEQEKQT